MSSLPPGDSDDRLVGRVLGEKYLVHRALGRSATSVVYEGENVLTREHVAIKVLASIGMDAARARLEREARVLARLTHRHIVAVREVGDDLSDTMFLVEELLDGPTLADVIAARGQLPLDEALDVLLPILAALGHSHEHGIVHRDVKPANIVLHRARGAVVPKLIDFGIARSLGLEPTVLDERIWGTPHYMAPEQVLAPLEADARVDVWGAALCLHEALTGVLPWRVESALDVARAARELDASDAVLPGGTPALRFALRAALRARPDERTRTVDDLARDLERARTAGRATSLRPTEPAPGSQFPPVLPQSVAPPGRPAHFALVETAPDVDAALVQDELGSVWGSRLAVLRMRSYAELVDALADGEAEVAWLPAVACAHALRRGVARLVVGVRRAVPTRAAIVARSSVARDLATLADARAVWVDPWSAAGYVVPRAMLRRAGLDPARALGSEHFVGSHGAVLAALRAGTADVGAVFAALVTGPDAGAALGADLCVLAVSEEIAPDAVCVACSVPEPVVAAARAALLAPGRSAALAAVLGADGFEAASAEAYLALARELDR